MDTEAQTALRGYDISWQTREGAPYSANDLNRVSAGSAETIILMRPENGRVRPFPSWHRHLHGFVNVAAWLVGRAGRAHFTESS